MAPGHAVSRRAFTLVEVMIAVVIVAVGTVTMLFAIAHGQRTTRAMEQRLAALHATQEAIEEVRGTAFDQIVSVHSGRTFAVPRLEGEGSVTIDATNPDLLDVAVAVSWTGPYGPTSVRLRTLVASR